MHALLLTTSTSKQCFNQLLEQANTPNPSNQHFYYLFAQMLSQKYEVDVLSYRPITKKNIRYYHYYKEQNNNVTYHYLPFWNIKGLKSFSISKLKFSEIKPLIKNDTVIFVDSLNISLVKLAFRISKKFHLPIVGIITDHPNNLSNAKKKYIDSVMKFNTNYDLYYCLTNDLNQACNIYKRPALIIHGLLDPINNQKDNSGFDRYFYFGGALYKRYGIENLLKAFHKWQGKYNLLIAGHGDEADLVRQYALKDERIHYLGLIPVEKALFYERNAVLNINPRPFDKSLDALSIPSKTLEYINSGVIMMTTENTHLRQILGNNVIWINQGDTKDIYNGFVDFEEMGLEDKNNKAREARAIVNNFYSLSVVSEKLDYFLRANISSSNFSTNEFKVK